MFKESTHLNREELAEQFSKILQQQLDLAKSILQEIRQKKTDKNRRLLFSEAREALVVARNSFDKLLYLESYTGKPEFMKSAQEAIINLEKEFDKFS